MNYFLKRYWVFIFLLLCFSCKRTVHGTGPIVSETKNVDHISEIELSIPANVTIFEADSFSCVIGAQKNILDIIKTKSDGDEFTIESDKNFNIEKPVQIVISLPKISALTINGLGDITCLNGLREKELKLEVNGSGKIKLSGNITDMESNINGSGDIYLDGRGEKHKVSINGSGNLHAYPFESAESKIEIAGSGDAEVTVTDELKADISGSGNIHYKGNPHVKSDITGSGEVRKTE